MHALLSLCMLEPFDPPPRRTVIDAPFPTRTKQASEKLLPPIFRYWANWHVL